MRTGRIHYATLANSARLQRLLAFLKERGAQGATTLEIVHGAQVCAVNSAAAELRRNGIDVECHAEGRNFRYRIP